MTSSHISVIYKIGASEPPTYDTWSYKNEYTQVSKPEEEGGFDHDRTLQLYLAVKIVEPMLMVHQPPSAAWPQASP